MEAELLLGDVQVDARRSVEFPSILHGDNQSESFSLIVSRGKSMAATTG